MWAEIKRIKTQTIISIGALLFWAGWLCDGFLLPYFFVFNYIGTALTFFGVGKWLAIKENRRNLKDVLGIRTRGSFVDTFKRAFDFSWKRISTLWGFITVTGIIMIHGMNLVLKSSDAYKAALESMRNDNRILETSGGIVHFSDMVTGRGNELTIGVIGKKKSFFATFSWGFNNSKKEIEIH